MRLVARTRPALATPAARCTWRLPHGPCTPGSCHSLSLRRPRHMQVCPSGGPFSKARRAHTLRTMPGNTFQFALLCGSDGAPWNATTASPLNNSAANLATGPKCRNPVGPSHTHASGGSRLFSIYDTAALLTSTNPKIMNELMDVSGAVGGWVCVGQELVFDRVSFE